MLLLQTHQIVPLGELELLHELLLLSDQSVRQVAVLAPFGCAAAATLLALLALRLQLRLLHEIQLQLLLQLLHDRLELFATQIGQFLLLLLLVEHQVLLVLLHQTVQLRWVDAAQLLPQ